MNRNLVLIGTVAAFGFAAVVAGAGDSARAVACDETAKAASVSSCCAKNGDAATASTKAAKVHGAMVKSAVVAPGAAPVLNAAAFGGALASNSDCSWCPEKCADAATAAAMGCTEYSAASLASCTKGAAAAKAGCASEASIQTAAMTASAGCDKGAVTTAAAAGCDKSTATAAGSSSEKGFAVAAGGDACCKSGNAAATAAKEGCKEVCDESKTATAFKGAVDELPYRENKRVVLTGAYVCGHCTLHVTDGCAPMFKTTDGKVYPLIKNAHASDLRKANTGKGIEIASSVKRIDGVKYLEVKSYKAL